MGTQLEFLSPSISYIHNCLFVCLVAMYKLSCIINDDHIHSSKKETPRLFICKFLNDQREFRGVMGCVGMNYTGQKKLLPIFLNFKLNKRGVSFLRECIPIILHGFTWPVIMSLVHDISTVTKRGKWSYKSKKKGLAM